MKNYIRIGNYIFDYIVLSVIVLFGVLLILPAYIVIFMAISYFENDNYKYMFKMVGQNIKPLLILTAIELFLGLMLLLTLNLNDTGILGIFHIIVMVVIVLFMTLLMLYPPMILLKMKVTSKQLFRNTIYLVCMHLKDTFMMLLLTGLMIYMVIHTIWALLLIVPYLQSISFISNKILTNEKEKKEKEEQK